jgi:signal transduction histidine kinase
MPLPQRLEQADADAQAIGRTFLLQFMAVATLAIGAAAFVVVLVRRAESLALERSRFAAAAAHELRTPLAGLQLYGDLLADGLGDPDKMRDYARRMSEEASRLGRVVSNVLTFSQLERDHLNIDATAGPLGEVLRELAERVRPTLDRAGATLEIDLPPDLRARFDRDALARIVGNLIDNAEKYARGAGDRTIRLAALDRGNVVEVTIEDRGPGIVDETKLFKPFSRGATGGDSPAGLGLGLVLSMSLARAMGGELTYHRRAGGGATFVLRLPAA